MLAVMGRPSLRGVFVTLLLLVVGFHFVSVTAAALPPNRYSEVVEPANDYLRPYFTQNWRLFAPNPIDADREVLFQASYRDRNGEVQLTELVNWTDVELSLVRHKVVGRRAGYVTNKLTSALNASRSRLTTDQRSVLTDVGSSDEPVSWVDLRDELNRNGRSPARVTAYLNYELATVRLGSSVVAARFPDLDVLAIRYVERKTPVVRYDKRHGDAATTFRFPDEAASGWRRVVAGTDAERDVIADFDRRHR